MSPKYSKPAYRGARTAVFITLGLSSVIPVTHALAIYGYERLREDSGLDWIVLSGALYIFGALL